MADFVTQKEVGKATGALLSIGELAEKIGVPTHVLRYWETRFPQLKPLQRSGRRRYYRPDDVALVARIYDLLHVQGYTVDGARKALSVRSTRKAADQADMAAAPTAQESAILPTADLGPQPAAIKIIAEGKSTPSVPVEKLVGLRNRLEAALT